jgi:hypothetical protein
LTKISSFITVVVRDENWRVKNMSAISNTRADMLECIARAKKFREQRKAAKRGIELGGVVLAYGIDGAVKTDDGTWVMPLGRKDLRDIYNMCLAKENACIDNANMYASMCGARVSIKKEIEVAQ